MINQSEGNNILDTNVVKKIGNDKFRVRVDIDTRIAGVDDFIISRDEFMVNCLYYIIRVENYEDFSDILESTKYLLLDEGHNPYKIRQIIKYLEHLEGVFEPIITFYRNTE